MKTSCPVCGQRPSAPDLTRSKPRPYPGAPCLACVQTWDQLTREQRAAWYRATGQAHLPDAILEIEQGVADAPRPPLTTSLPTSGSSQP